MSVSNKSIPTLSTRYLHRRRFLIPANSHEKKRDELEAIIKNRIDCTQSLAPFTKTDRHRISTSVLLVLLACSYLIELFYLYHDLVV